jgi:hypothetical protein
MEGCLMTDDEFLALWRVRVVRDIDLFPSSIVRA